MSKKSSIALLIGVTLLGFVNLTAQRTTYILPGTYFDKNVAANALAPGNSAIRGVAYTKGSQNSKRFQILLDKLGKKKLARRGTIVRLFPLTPYFQEYLELRSKYKPSGKKIAVITPEAYKYRIETAVVDDNGNFQFTNLKPGKYLLEAEVTYTKTGTASEQVGTETGYNVYGEAIFSNPIYADYSIAYDITNYVSETVEITEDEAIIEVGLH